ncbi:glycoside hydrolase family 19 protein [Ciceribacter sp. L1K22]|uniref:glycoside hydrolase family 19 protein n=1 Tax=Ciceribacter sp. L1K22 TaxID=2820275 RepID=UPI001ABE2009|nr:glycoside hydrolase family 19 protein [Ciceribacter sp. L1K22]MBO3759471.1 hypothetical protein [Ciceribacter sp. L1K22]
MTMMSKAFFDAVRRDPFPGRLSRGQVAGMTEIAAAWERLAAGEDPRGLAYGLATAFHETAGTMQAVRETLAKTDSQAVARLDRAYAAGRLPQVKRPYWRPDGEGKTWYGRGLVQITHKSNYQRLSEATRLDLVTDPDRALDLEVAATVLVVGMVKGLFSGRRLGEFFNGTAEDWRGARRIVNGTDREDLVAGYGKAFWRAMAA